MTETALKKIMLIEQYHDAETRVALLENGVLKEFDWELSHSPTRKGNIYMGRVARVEPALQAVFVEFGQDRHGFLPFSEIHPDYYTPVKPTGNAINTTPGGSTPVEDLSLLSGERAPMEGSQEPHISDAVFPVEEKDGSEDAKTNLEETETIFELVEETSPKEEQPISQGKKGQEIKKNQRLLVQVVKDERGGKGAALTTYISLPGKYMVLMSNTSAANGVSRKITETSERDRIKAVIASLSIPSHMSVIVRTAGLHQSKAHMKRDLEYLVRLWKNIQKKSLSLKGQELVYEEQDLVVRALRDLYTPETQAIWVEGEDAYKKAKSLMRMFLPAHTKRILLHNKSPKLFQQWNVETQIEAIYKDTVILPSGGAIVIHQTEALVAIDVNSGRSIKEKNIESTALKTNLEAAEAIAQHLRLRNLSGLVVIDFIDMIGPNNQQVERAFSQAVQADRARIQLGKISRFGLLELSRQRLKKSFLETHTSICQNCEGHGRVSSIWGIATKVLRHLESVVKQPSQWVLRGHQSLILHLINDRKKELERMTTNHGVEVVFEIDPQLLPNVFHAEEKLPIKRWISGTPLPLSREPAPALETEEKTPRFQNQSKHKRRQRKGGISSSSHLSTTTIPPATEVTLEKHSSQPSPEESLSSNVPSPVDQERPSAPLKQRWSRKKTSSGGDHMDNVTTSALKEEAILSTVKEESPKRQKKSHVPPEKNPKQTPALRQKKRKPSIPKDTLEGDLQKPLTLSKTTREEISGGIQEPSTEILFNPHKDPSPSNGDKPAFIHKESRPRRAKKHSRPHGIKEKKTGTILLLPLLKGKNSEISREEK